MAQAEQLSRLIGDIYDASLDQALWPSALERVCRFVGGSGAGLHVMDVARRTGKIYCEVGTEPGYAQLYFDKYARFDPMGAAIHVLDVGEVTSNSLLVPPAEFLESRFYKEWVRPQGLIDNIMVVLDKSATSHTGHVVLRHERDGLADDPARQRMRLIVPHLRRAVLIGKIIDLKAAEAASFADALDGIGAGMFLVDARGRVVHANASGHALLAERCPLHAVGGRLAVDDAGAEHAIHEAILAAGDGDAAVGTKGIAVPLPKHDRDPYVAHVLPLTSGARRRAGATYAAVAVVFVHKAAQGTPAPPEVIAKTFNLTPSELRVLLAIVEVGGVPQVAETLGVSRTTVRFHLRQLFEKTGTHRQADLVKLVAGFANPAGG